MEDVQRFWDEQVVTFDEEPITASPTGRFGWRGHGYCTGCYRRRGPTSSTLAAAREACPYFSQSSLTADQAGGWSASIEVKPQSNDSTIPPCGS